MSVSLSSLQLLYLVPRLLPEVRDDLPARGEEAGGTGTGVKGLWPEGREQDQWSCLTDDSAPWRTSVRALWSHAAFRLVLQLPQCQVRLQEKGFEESLAEVIRTVLTCFCRFCPGVFLRLAGPCVLSAGG